ncbi:MAG: hypothetical protein JJ992_16050, partial [Planctomycetes bacterium]|nr:hypothetical protein [Planctomycetota bacterium]
PGLRSDDHTAHPDCSAHALLVSDGIRSRPWRRNSETQASRIDHRRGPRHPFIVSILSFMQPHTRDEERLRRCTVASVAGPSLVPLCSLSCGGATKPLADRVARVPGCPGTPGGVVGLERASVKQPAAVEGSDVLAGTVLAHS